MNSVFLILNKPFPSNCFVLSVVNCKNCIVIDPGTSDSLELISFINSNSLKVECVWLTHEHFDHCSGVNELYHWSPFELICTSRCAKNIQSSKQNFSLYHDDTEEFEIAMPVTIANDGLLMSRAGIDFVFHETPGHSPGSACIVVDNMIFTGDTLLNRVKSPLTFPHSSRNDYEDSLGKLKRLLHSDIIIYPGHGEPFKYNHLNQV